MAALSPQPRLRFFDELGLPLEGGFVYTYIAGTTTPLATYTDQSGMTANPNPMPLESDGGASIWFKGAYKIDVKKNTGVSLTGYPVDNVNIYDLLDWSQLTASIADLNATDTSTKLEIADYSVILSDRGKTILGDTTSGAFTITLPTAAEATNGFELTLKKIDINTTTITIIGADGENIEGRTSFLLYDQNDVVTFLCDGSNWRIKSGVIRGNTQLMSAAFATTISDIDKTFICSASAPYAVTLLSAVTAGDGFRQTFKKTNDINLITITAAGMETIDGNSTFLLGSIYQSVSIISNGTNWLIIVENSGGNAWTSQIRLAFLPTAPTGWIIMDDGSIGSATSGATTRANADTLNLFVMLWNSVPDGDAPVSGGRGVSALADFNANKNLTLPRILGRVLGVAGSGSGLTPRGLGEFLGEETHVLTIPEMPSHNHGSPADNFLVTGGTDSLTSGGGAQDSGSSVTMSTGGGSAHNNMQPTLFLRAFIKL